MNTWITSRYRATLKESGNFNFAFDLNTTEDIEFYLTVYKRKIQTGKLGDSSAYTTSLYTQSQHSDELSLLFSTKECYEGFWGKKRISRSLSAKTLISKSIKL